jgi:hypothetical protein
MKNAVFWNMTPCRSCKYDVWEERIASIIRVARVSVLQTTTPDVLVTADIVLAL